MKFLEEVAKSFHSHGYSEDACSICHISSTHNSPQLVAMEIEILGAVKQTTNMWKIIDQVILSVWCVT